MSSFERRMQLRRLLEGGGREWSLLELAQRFSVSKLTVQRDLDQLSVAGVEVECRREGQRQLWFIRRSSAASPRASGGATGAALSAAGQALAAFRGTELQLGLERARRGEPGGAQVLRPRLPGSRRRLSPVVVRTVLAAIDESRQVRLQYLRRGAEASTELVLEPHAFEEANGLVYLSGRHPGRLAPRRCTLVAWRIREAELLEESFIPPTRPVRRAFGAFDGPTQLVVVHFEPEVAEYLEERVWHPSQRLTRHADGGLTWQARVSGMHEVVGWVMSWGHRAELLQPESWRMEVVRRLEAMSDRYRTPGATTPLEPTAVIG